MCERDDETAVEKGREGLPKQALLAAGDCAPVPSLGERVHTCDEFALFLVEAIGPEAQEILASGSPVAWGQRPDLVEHAASLVDALGIGRLHLGRARSPEDRAALADVLEKRGVTLVDHVFEGNDTHHEAEDDDEVARRLQDLGYL